MREVIPSATANVKTKKKYGTRDVLVVTALPEGWAAIHRKDGTLLLALQAPGGADDLSRDLAAILIRAMETEPGTVIGTGDLPGPGPRLQDILNLAHKFEVTVHSDLPYWFDASMEVTDEVRAALDEAASALVPTVKIDAVPGAYWCQMAHPFLRWARPEGEDELIDAIARLHARRASGLADGRFVGAFRSCGLLIPVWELPDGTTADDLHGPLRDLSRRLAAALANTEPLDANERRARAGIVSRQVNLR
jgi:hypothetical protein